MRELFLTLYSCFSFSSNFIEYGRFVFFDKLYNWGFITESQYFSKPTIKYSSVLNKSSSFSKLSKFQDKILMEDKALGL